MIQVKEICSDVSIESSFNDWIIQNPGIKIVDIKYSADSESSNALIIYKSEDK